MSENVDAGLERLLDYLSKARGFDFTGYKRTTLSRRIRKRMGEIPVDSYGTYQAYLQSHSDEFARLFNTILINVTHFFRDPREWDFLAEEVIPRLLQTAETDGQIRAWCAGCASGEEAYSLAILLAEAMGTDEFRRRVKIYATDVDDEALSLARPGGHASKDLDGVRPEWREKYFEQMGSRKLFRPDLRRSMIFGRHDLVQDAPISRLDLLVCRNTLMYFTPPTQARVLGRFHYALKDSGFLFLGKAEMLLTHVGLFLPIDMKHRVFTKVPRPNLRDRLPALTYEPEEDDAVTVGQVHYVELASEALPLAQVVIDDRGVVVAANDRARLWFGLAPADLGRPVQDLEISYRPVELRSVIERAAREGQIQRLAGVDRGDGATPRFVDVGVAPLPDDSQGLAGISITFSDVTDYNRLRSELERSRQELETAYEELQSTNEELETTNEELQSTVEELETTNEELQSSNEELETMNEELESANAELQTINDELRQRTSEMEGINAFMNSVMTGLQLGVVVVDSERKVRMWNSRSEDLWGVRASEAHDRPLEELDIGLPFEPVLELVEAVMAGRRGRRDLIVEATNRRGRTIRVRIIGSSLALQDPDGQGVILLVEDLGGRDT